MPQMKPMNWITLFTLFSLILLINMMINYFQINIHPSTKPSTPILKSNNWKW